MTIAPTVFKRFLGGGIGFGVAWPQHPLGVVEPLEILPTSLGVNLAPRLALDPAGYFGACPQATIGWRLIEGLVELGLLLWREDERAARIAVAAVAQALRTLVIVTMGKGADPRRAVAGDESDLFGRLALGKQPDDLPVASLHWIFGLAVTPLDGFDAHMSFQGEWFFHKMSIPQDLI